MGKIMEAIFCVTYLIVTLVLGCGIINNSKEKKEYNWFGIMALVLVFGDAFHLVPRVMAAINTNMDYTFALGIGTMITSITMTVFYLIMFYVYSMRYEYDNVKFKYGMIALAAIRIILCLMPQNDWTGESPVNWGIYRNIPFLIMGAIMIFLYYKKKDDAPFKWMWLAITLSFAFYLPVVLWADVSPMIGMLMLPKTCMYVWMVLMGYKLVKSE